MRYIIFENGIQINTIIADENFCKIYCQENNYTYQLLEEPEPIIEIKTDTLSSVSQDDIDAMLIDQEYRITMLELGITSQGE